MSMTADQLATQLAGYINQRVEGTLTDAQLVTNLETLFENWLSQSVSTAGLALSVQNLVVLTSNVWLQVSAWQAGTAGGGPNNDGTYPITDLGGTTVYVPCLAQAAADAAATASAQLVTDINDGTISDDAITAIYNRMKALNLFANQAEF